MRLSKGCVVIFLHAILMFLVSCVKEVSSPEDDPLIFTTEPGRLEPFGYNDNIGEQNTAVLLVRFSDMMEVTHTPDVYRKAIFEAQNSVNAFLKEASYNKTWLSGSVFGWYNSEDVVPSDQESMIKQALEISKDDLDISQFDRLVIITPQLTSGPYYYPAGSGTIGKVTLETSDGFVNVSVQHIIWEGYINLELQLAAVTISHEFMHNFGMWHANSYECNDDPINYTYRECTSREYGNGFSILGTRKHARHPTAFAKEWIGWLTEAEILTARENGRYVIYPLEEESDKAKTIRIPLKKELKLASTYGEGAYSATEYYVEFRRPLGFDFIEPELDNVKSVNMNGVFVYTWAERKNRNVFFEPDNQMLTFLLDMTPESKTSEFDQGKPDDFSDGILQIGNTFRDENNGIKVTPLQIRSDGGIEVHVEVDK